jgi:hypothetical protein
MLKYKMQIKLFVLDLCEWRVLMCCVQYHHQRWVVLLCVQTLLHYYRGADKFLARPTSLCIFFDGENISFDASLVICINIISIPSIMIINRIYEAQNLLSL